jgi:hypothetical protein
MSRILKIDKILDGVGMCCTVQLDLEMPRTRWEHSEVGAH